MDPKGCLTALTDSHQLACREINSMLLSLTATYQLRKKFICKKNKSENNEKLLFHGTAASSLSSINYYGFDRGYAGKNGESLSKSVNFLDMYECYRMSML